MSRRLDLLIERAKRVLEEKQVPVETVIASEIAVFDFDKTLGGIDHKVVLVQ